MITSQNLKPVKLLNWLFLVILLVAPLPLSAQPEALSVGEVESIDPIAVSIVGPVQDEVRWTRELRFDDNSLNSFALNISNIEFPTNAQFTIEVRDNRLALLQKWTSTVLNGRVNFWTAPIDGNYAFLALRIKILNSNEELTFVIDKISKSFEQDAELESIVGNTRDFQYTYEFNDEPEIVRAGRSVAKLHFVIDGSSYTCTGFMVAGSLMLTNEHCVDSQAVCDTTTAIFGYEYIKKGNNYVLNPGEAFACRKHHFSDADADWSLIELMGAPGARERWGFLPISNSKVADNDSIVLIQHPAGYPKIVTKLNCRVTTLEAPGRVSGINSDFGHSCDSIRGSSGAPILSANASIVVGQHHWGFDSGDQRWDHENRAIHVTEFCVPSALNELLPTWPACGEQ